MPTVVTKTVKPGGGGDYTSLWDACGAEVKNLVAADEIMRFECYAGADTTKLIIAGWTTDATRYIHITVPSAERHRGTYSTSKYRMEVVPTLGGNSIGIEIRANHYVVIEGIQLQYTSSDIDTQGVGIYTEGSGVTLGEIILKAVLSGTATPSAGIWTDTGVVKIRNCLLYDWVRGTTDIAGVLHVSGSTYCYNTTVQNCRTGFNSFGGTTLVKNCLAQDCNDGFLNTFDAASRNNASDIASDAPGSNPQTGAVTFVNKAGDDFHLSAVDTVAKDNGVDLSADALLAFSTDIDGATRAGAWDIGADENTGLVVDVHEYIRSESVVG